MEKYGDYLYSLALFKTGSKELAEDLLQNTLVSALENLENFKAESSVKTWLVRILNNKIIDHYRHESVRRKAQEELQQQVNHSDDHFFEPTKVSPYHWKEERYPGEWEVASDQELEQSEFYSVLEQCLGKVPQKWRLVFTKKYLSEQESENICKEMEISPSNYWVIMHRVKLALRSCLELNWIKL
ncbi:MAG: sigma-70 family RNA polymerase sigma factor [Bacteroidetes bacterium]|nr:MAG: sigma-70 family RNA polymerase sigma factor [Bacteroidota bacterium]